MKRIQKLILIGLMGWIFIMTGCAGIGKTKEDVAKETLKAKYNEEFIIHSISNLPGGVDVVASPLNNPEIVFSARISDDASYILDDYAKQYISKILNDKFETDLQNYFIESYIRTTANVVLQDSDMDFKQITMDNIDCNINTSEGYTKNIYLEVYIDMEKGTNRDFEGEYNYFENVMHTINLETSLTIHFFAVDGQTLRRVREYYKDNIIWDGSFEKEILGVDNYETGTVGSGSFEKSGTHPILECHLIMVYMIYLWMNIFERERFLKMAIYNNKEMISLSQIAYLNIDQMKVDAWYYNHNHTYPTIRELLVEECGGEDYRI